MRKFRVWVIAALCIITAGGAAAVFFMSKNASVFRSRSGDLSAAQQKYSAETGSSPAEKIKLSDEQIHGQAVYDARAALPPQAMLNIRLIETDTKNGASKIIAEKQEALPGQSPLSWVLPVKLNRLNKTKSYVIQAKISGGDTLLFVNPVPTSIDASHAAYIIHLSKIDGGAADITAPRNLIGADWDAISLKDKNIEPDSEISFFIGEEIKSDPMEIEKHYRVSGSDGCNHYSAAATINEKAKTLQLSPLTTSFITCAPNLNHQEADFIAAMGKARFYLIDETGGLSLLDANRTPLARFIPAH